MRDRKTNLMEYQHPWKSNSLSDYDLCKYEWLLLLSYSFSSAILRIDQRLSLQAKNVYYSDSDDDGVVITKCSGPFRKAANRIPSEPALKDAQEKYNSNQPEQCIQLCSKLLEKQNETNSLRTARIDVLILRADAYIARQQYSQVGSTQISYF